MVESKPAAPGTTVLTAHARNVDAAERAFAALIAAGIPEGEMSVLAHGLEVDRRLIHSEEVNANRMARQGPGMPAGPLARKLSSGPLLLLEGCWATGPLFTRHASRTGRQGGEELARALLGTGMSLEEAASLETRLRKDGGVWFALACSPEAAAAARKALEAVAGVEVFQPAA